MNIPFQKITVIDFGLVQIHIWGLLIALGMLAGLLFTLHEAKKRYKIPESNIYDIFILMFLSSMLGARIFYILLFWSKFAENPINMLKVWDGGLIYYGGFLAALLTIYIYLKRKKIKFWKAADMMAPGLALGLGIGRIGCYLIGDHLGSKTSFFLGSMYNGELRHEPSLYLSFKGFLIFLVLLFLRKKVKKEGVIAYTFLIMYSVLRFLFDFARASDVPGLSDPRFFSLTISQWISIVMFLIFAPLLIRKLIRD